jgi:hypothetical protein
MAEKVAKTNKQAGCKVMDKMQNRPFYPAEGSDS